MDKKYEVIDVESGYVATETVEHPRKGDWVYEKDNTIPIYQFSYDMDNYPLPKIIGHTGIASLEDSGLPIFRIPEKDVEAMARKFYWKRHPGTVMAENSRPDMVIGFIEGYRQAGGYTEEDMGNLWDFYTYNRGTFRDFMDSLKKKPIAISVEMEDKRVFSHYSQDLMKIAIYKGWFEPKLVDNKLIIKEVVYSPESNIK